MPPRPAAPHDAGRHNAGPHPRRTTPTPHDAHCFQRPIPPPHAATHDAEATPPSSSITVRGDARRRHRPIDTRYHNQHRTPSHTALRPRHIRRPHLRTRTMLCLKRRSQNRPLIVPERERRKRTTKPRATTSANLQHRVTRYRTPRHAAHSKEGHHVRNTHTNTHTTTNTHTNPTTTTNQPTHRAAERWFRDGCDGLAREHRRRPRTQHRPVLRRSAACREAWRESRRVPRGRPHVVHRRRPAVPQHPPGQCGTRTRPPCRAYGGPRCAVLGRCSVVHQREDLQYRRRLPSRTHPRCRAEDVHSDVWRGFRGTLVQCGPRRRHRDHRRRTGACAVRFTSAVPLPSAAAVVRRV